MRAGDRFPPISVLPVGRRLIITDGHKRFSAAKTLGLTQVTVELWTVRHLTFDLARQTRESLRAAGRAASGLIRGPDGRRESKRFATQILAHWRRTLRSLWKLIRGRLSV
jgi:hypothetical protein